MGGRTVCLRHFCREDRSRSQRQRSLRPGDAHRSTGSLCRNRLTASWDDFTVYLPPCNPIQIVTLGSAEQWCLGGRGCRLQGGLSRVRRRQAGRLRHSVARTPARRGQEQTLAASRLKTSSPSWAGDGSRPGIMKAHMVAELPKSLPRVQRTGRVRYHRNHRPPRHTLSTIGWLYSARREKPQAGQAPQSSAPFVLGK